ncbi:type II toxin-antitoxin system Phd/YefM family antitoxin [Phenylobacterium sp. Root77]|jgi:prevent-host-death family protein|uniref:type II toxin-antitoxin system Phd/YefM family antitoxin n=2 Tax=Phenylobacterium TaxID=20 RepID=UPI001F2899E5|nr:MULTISPECIES: type II toxin-antitoxin system prevent-host-death family antitoxin [unclassified Phenylobacterium]
MVHIWKNDPPSSRSVVVQISVSDAKAQLTDLVRRAEAGDDVVLTRHGRPTARLVAIKAVGDRAARRQVMETLRLRASRKAVQGASAASSQDFLYNDDGLPE